MSKEYKELVGLYESWQTISIPVYVQRKLDGNDYGVGRLEAATNEAENNSNAMGKLMELLFEKGIISLDDIKNIC